MSRDSQGEDARLIWPKLLKREVFRRTFIYAGVIAVATTALAGFMYCQTVGFLRIGIDTHLLTDTRAIAAEPGPSMAARLTQALSADPHQMRVGGIFDAEGRVLAGNLLHPPHPLPKSGTIDRVDDPVGLAVPGKGNVRVGRVSLPDGSYLIFGRRVDELHEVDSIVSRDLATTAVCLVILALIGGALLGRVATRRVRAVEEACRHIMAGRLNERLPLQARDDEFNALSATVNQMLDEMERLMGELKCAGDAIAHDLRTPLTRLKARLERVMESLALPPSTREEIRRTLADVDQLLTTTRALLRLGEIESGRRRAQFAMVDVAEIVHSINELYGPIAEEKGVTFIGRGAANEMVWGDGELIFEAVANLVDNATKFTPGGGTITVELVADAEDYIVRVDDTGPGVPDKERDLVLRRFYQSDPARRAAGSGLGLSIVAAIARLHDFTLNIGSPDNGHGCRVELCVRLQSTTQRATP